MSAVAPGAAAPRDRFVTARGLRFHLREAGDPTSPAVLVLHGVMGHAREWDTLIAALAGEFHVHALDQRGHGETDRASEYSLAALAGDVAALLGALGLSRAHLVGHSLGAMAAAQCAAAHPHLADRLVLIELPPDVPDTRFGHDLAARIAGLAAVTYPDAQQAVDEWLADNPLADPVAMRHYVGCLVPRPDGRLGWRFDTLGLPGLLTGGVTSGELWAALDRIIAPTVLIRGRQSPLLSAETAAEMLHRLTHGRLVEVPRGGHDLGVEQPAAVAAAIRALLVGP